MAEREFINMSVDELFGENSGIELSVINKTNPSKNDMDEVINKVFGKKKKTVESLSEESNETDEDFTVTEEMFLKAVGRPPVYDELERCNCKATEVIGHMLCGWCKKCNCPRFICGHRKEKNNEKEN